jgi:NhaP-type Na+/H+ or K+/H+ antiporter
VAVLRGTAGLPIRLLGIGLPLTIALGVAVAIVVVPGLTVLDAVILAMLVAPTDAALGVLVVTSERIPIRIRQALNVEAGLNDGIVTPLVIVAGTLAAAGGLASSDGWVADAAAQLALGVLAGGLVGGSGGLLLRLAHRHQTILPGARWMAAPAIAILAWFVAHELGGNAFVAAFVAGFATTATFGRVPDAFLEFAAVGGEFIGLAVFFMFAVLVPSLTGFSPAVVVFAVMALTVIRMVPVAISLVGTGLALPSIALIGWFGPRGLASLVLAIIVVGDGSAAAGFSPVVIAAVAVTILFSVIAHGLSAGPAVAAYGRIVDRLGPDAPERRDAAPLPTRGSVIQGLGPQPRAAP